MIINVIMLVVSLAMILAAAVVFTNGIEILGHRLKLHQGVVGSILAAVGTALPETVIPIIAILFFTSAEAHQVGIGAIAGAPFMLGTLAFFVTGLAVMIYTATGRRTRAIHTDVPTLSRDLTFFLVLYGIAILTSFVHDFPLVKTTLAIGLVLGYGVYIWMTIGSEGQAIEDVEILHFNKYLFLPETRPVIIIQIIAALVLMIWGAHLFVSYTSAVSLKLGIPAMILSIIITPIATELPEKCNSVIWIGKRKDILAMGNITGAMVFQSSFPVAFGMAFTPWDLTGIPMVSALLAFGSAGLVLAWVRIRKSLNPYILMAGGLFYLAFIGYLMLRR
ncbi:MAG: sodium:calcium antiporter [bacterium]